MQLLEEIEEKLGITPDEKYEHIDNKYCSRCCEFELGKHMIDDWNIRYKTCYHLQNYINENLSKAKCIGCDAGMDGEVYELKFGYNNYNIFFYYTVFTQTGETGDVTIFIEKFSTDDILGKISDRLKTIKVSLPN